MANIKTTLFQRLMLAGIPGTEGSNTKLKVGRGQSGRQKRIQYMQLHSKVYQYSLHFLFECMLHSEGENVYTFADKYINSRFNF